MLKAFFRSTTGKAVLIIVVALVAWNGWLSWAGPRKVAPDVREAMKSGEQVDIRIELNFPPERFHVLTFQDFGRVTGTNGNFLELRGVEPTSVARVARHYWVRHVTLLPPFTW